MSGLLDLCNSVKNPVDHAAKLTSPKKPKVKRVVKKPKIKLVMKKPKIHQDVIAGSRKPFLPFFSPIWIERDLGKGRRITSIRLKNGLREKHCPNCGKWKPSNTEYFSPDKPAKIGLYSWCRICIRTKQNLVKRRKRYEKRNSTSSS